LIDLLLTKIDKSRARQGTYTLQMPVLFLTNIFCGLCKLGWFNNADGVYLVKFFDFLVLLVSRITEMYPFTEPCLPLAETICKLYAISRENYQYSTKFSQQDTSSKPINFYSFDK
jgi:hypothetical protein